MIQHGSKEPAKMIRLSNGWLYIQWMALLFSVPMIFEFSINVLKKFHPNPNLEV